MSSGSHSSMRITDSRKDSVSPRSQITLEEAILYTVVYSDLFDYPLTANQIFRYLIDISIPLSEVEKALNHGRRISSYLSQHNGYFFLSGREKLVPTRYQRTKLAAKIWPKALYYSRAIFSLPFVRMVAVTGSLAMNNIREGGDIDLFIVVAPHRVWLCRAMIMVLARLALLSGIFLCPNFIISESSLQFPKSERNIYTAHEIVQMVPITGFNTYKRMRKLNSWTFRFLPNADGPPQIITKKYTPKSRLRPFIEALLQTPAGNWLERKEMGRVVRKFRRTANFIQSQVLRSKQTIETTFNHYIIKDHFRGNNQRILKAFIAQLKSLNQEMTRVTNWLRDLHCKTLAEKRKF